jgi:hypothetical protein
MKDDRNARNYNCIVISILHYKFLHGMFKTKNESDTMVIKSNSQTASTLGTIRYSGVYSLTRPWQVGNCSSNMDSSAPRSVRETAGITLPWRASSKH